MEGEDPRELVGRVEGLLEEVEALADPASREKATEVVSALLDLYGEGLARIIEQVAERDDGTVAEAMASDELVSHLLLLHGLHPVAAEARVRQALEEVRPYLESHGGNVELLAVEDGTARLRLEGSCSGCPSSAMTLKLAIENAIAKSAPDILEVEAEGAVAVAPAPAPALIQLEVVGSNGGGPRSDGGPREGAGRNGSWAMAGAMPELAGGSGDTPLARRVAGEEILFVGIAGSVYAYRPGCPECGDSLEGGRLDKSDLSCPGCGNRYDVLRAGRCLDAPQLHLEPVPLLVGDDGLVKVALGAAA